MLNGARPGAPPSEDGAQASGDTFDFGARPCPGCGESAWQAGPRIPSWPTLLSAESPRLVECATCGSAHLPAVRLEDCETNAPVTAESAVTHRTKASRNLDDLYPLLSEHLSHHHPRALVVGCSTGYEIEALLDCPIRFAAVDGLDANKGAADRAREIFVDQDRVKIHQGYVELFRGEYELVTATMVLEHLPDPYSALRAVSEQQPTGGLLSVQVPRYDNRIPRVIRGRSWYYIMDAHLWYFSRQGLGRMLERCGYEVIEVRNAPRYATLSFALDKIVRAVLRLVGPPFVRGGDHSADWEKIWRTADRLERKMEEIAERAARSGFGLATKCFKMGALNDAMTAVGRKRDSSVR
jgi:SAM-dependent methyltransferase